MRLGLGLHINNPCLNQAARAAAQATGEQPPSGQVFLTDDDGAVVTDSDNADLTEAA